MNAPDVLEEKFFELFNRLRLSEAEQQAAKGYISGKAEHNVLDSFIFEDLSVIPADPAIRLFRELVKTNQRDIAGRLFSVLLAKGESTCFRMIPMEVIDPQKGATHLEIDTEKKTALYAAILGADMYPLGAYSRDCLLDIACRKTEILKQAVSFEKSKSGHGKLVLYAIYFMQKYKCEDKEKTVEPEDHLLLAQYEELAIESLDELFSCYHPSILHTDFSVSEIKDAVRKGEVTERILEMSKLNRGISSQVLRVLAGMAYLNYLLSAKLKDIVKICLATKTEDTLNAISLISMATPIDIYTRGGNYDKEFDISSEKYIAWAAKMGHTLILERQQESNFETYIKVMDDFEYEISNKMFDVIKTKNKPVYDELLKKRKQYGYSKETEKLVNNLVHSNYADGSVIKAYLLGKTGVDTLYPIVDKQGKNYYYSGNGHIVMNRKDELDPAFYRRFQTYLWLWKGTWLLRHSIMKTPNYYSSPEVSTAKVAELFQSFAYEGLDIARQLDGISRMELYIYGKEKDWFHNTVLEVFERYLESRREETIQAFATSDADGRMFGLEVFSKNAEENKKEILAYTEDSAKKVKQALLDILRSQTGWTEEIKALLTSKKAAARELAVRVLASWQETGADYKELLAQAAEKEKNAKVKELLNSVAGLKNGGSGAGKTLSHQQLVEELHKNNKKRTILWAYETPFSTVHTLVGEPAEEKYLQAVLLCYSAMNSCGCSKDAEFLAKELNQKEFAVYVNELFDKWLSAGAESKKKWVLFASAIHGGSEIIVRLQRQIKEWPKNLRGAIACDAVQALSLNPLPQALLVVDGIARKFKYKQVRAAAEHALTFAAEQLGITMEELADRIVPDLGFDEEMGRSFDYGARKFRVMITTALEIEVFEELENKKADCCKQVEREQNKEQEQKKASDKPEDKSGQAVQKHMLGKKLKSLPAPGKKDDEKKAAEAYEEFKQMKKQIKTVISSQKMRLEQALSSARLWSTRSWKRLFVKNPIMHQFAIGLIWGIYKDGTLVQSFRYMEDGSFNTPEEEEYFLPESDHIAEKEEQTEAEDKKIGLVHPVELTKEDLEAWRQQLEDYEIKQPFMQLERPVFLVDEGELTQRKFSRFSGRKINAMSLSGRFSEFGWYHGPVLDAGCFNTYYREDKEIGLSAELHFSGNSVGFYDEEVQIHSVRFYKIGDFEPGYCVYDENSKNKPYLLKDVPARYFSEIIMQTERATATVEMQSKV